jgi:predicted GH43/DUF377 family glycosyl hydrolase
MVKWERVTNYPILEPSGTGFDAKSAFNPTARKLMFHNANSQLDRMLYALFYRGQDEKGISSIGLVTSTDGISFERKEQVLRAKAPYEVGGGVEDPRIHQIGEKYFLTYTAYDGKNAQLALAVSDHVRNWKRQGVIIPAGRWGWSTHWTKSGAIIQFPISGKYFMYYMADENESDGADQMGIACSLDLMDWKEAFGKPLLRRRKGFFDSRVVEPGPPPILTEEGILLIYNGADDNLVYRTGWALFDSSDPTKVLARSDEPIFTPKLTWECEGQTKNVVFVEGCVEEERQTLFYYGAADTYVGAAQARK